MVPIPAIHEGDPWAVDARDHPFSAPFREQLRFLLRFAILAPSTHNTQPWRFRLVGDDGVEVWADPARALPRIDPARRQLFMSCGAALFHLRVGIRRFGSLDEVEYLPDPTRPDLVAWVRRGPPIRPLTRDAELFSAIPRRRTYRAPFAQRPVSHELAEALAREASTEGAWLERLHPHDKVDVAWLIANADRKQFADPTFRQELGRWLRSRGSRRLDGIPMARKDVPTSVPVAGLVLLRALDLGDGIAAREQALATDSPMLAIVGTDLDEPRDWIACGEAMEAVILRATHLGLVASFLNQAVEEPELRGPIAQASHRRGFPQLILRFGWGDEITPTPRRPLGEVMLAPDVDATPASCAAGDRR